MRARIEGYTSEGMGVARADGMAVFVGGAARGDLCDIRIVKVQKNHAYGKIERLIEPSPDRVSPDCPAFGRCGGCDFWHLSEQAERTLKQARVADALRRIGGFEQAPLLPIGHSKSAVHYRNKAQFPLRTLEGETRFGFYRPRSRDLVPLSRCLIQDERANAVARAVCLWADQNSVPCYDESTGRGLLRHVLVRTGSGGAHVCLVCTELAFKAKDALVRAILDACPDTCGIVLNQNDRSGNRIMGEVCVTLYGDDHLTDTLCGSTLNISPLSFYQVNHPVAEEMYAHIVRAAVADRSDTVLDLYCGIGTITLELAKACTHAIGAELVEQAVRDAQKNAALNGVLNVEFLCGDAGQIVRQLSERNARVDAVVCDPPRKGMDRQAIEAVLSLEPARIVYVACDPAALARDAARICEAGYRLTEVKPFDMFPKTANVETVALLLRSED